MCLSHQLVWDIGPGTRCNRLPGLLNEWAHGEGHRRINSKLRCKTEENGSYHSYQLSGTDASSSHVVPHLFVTASLRGRWDHPSLPDLPKMQRSWGGGGAAYVSLEEGSRKGPLALRLSLLWSSPRQLAMNPPLQSSPLPHQGGPGQAGLTLSSS